MRIPTDKEILTLHEKHAPNSEALDRVYSHCAIVCEIAEQLLARRHLDLDSDLVRAGALLHDIGVYRLHDEDYIRHGLLGYELLREEGFPEAICRFASHHTGVGLTADDVIRQGLPLPPADYLAETGEEELVMYADKFHSKTNPPTFLTADAYRARIGRFGADKEAAFNAMVDAYGEPDVVEDGQRPLRTRPSPEQDPHPDVFGERRVRSDGVPDLDGDGWPLVVRPGGTTRESFRNGACWRLAAGRHGRWR